MDSVGSFTFERTILVRASNNEYLIGHDVAITPEFAVIGEAASDDVGDGDTRRAAFVYRRDGALWSESATLMKEAVSHFDRFGWSIAAEGNTIVVGDVGHNWGEEAISGALFVYRDDATTWTLVAQLGAAEPAYWDEFGFSVDLEGDTIIAGMPNAFIGRGAGSAFIFRDDSDLGDWTSTIRTEITGFGQRAQFGSASSVSGDTIAVGSRGLNGAAVTLLTGAVYVYEDVSDAHDWTTRTLVKLRSPPSSQNVGLLNFGQQLDLDGNTLVVGVPLNDDRGEDAGNAYIYQRDAGAWTLTQTLAPNQLEGGDGFGVVVMDESLLVIGAPGDDDVGEDAGAVYVFSRDPSGWSQVAKLTSEVGTAGDRFGGWIDMKGGYIIVAGGPVTVFKILKRNSADTAWSRYD